MLFIFLHSLTENFRKIAVTVQHQHTSDNVVVIGRASFLNSLCTRFLIVGDSLNMTFTIHPRLGTYYLHAQEFLAKLQKLTCVLNI